MRSARSLPAVWALLGTCVVAGTAPRAAAAALPKLDFVFMTPAEPRSTEFLNPMGLAYDAATERLYVADTGHSRVVMYNKNGMMLSSFRHWIKYYDGKRIPGEPWRLLPGDRGTLLVADRLSDRIDIVDIFGAVVDSIDVTALLGSKDRAAPGAMARDAAGNLYLLERTCGQVVVFDRAWRKLRSFGPKSDADSRFKSLAGIAVAPDGTTYVLDSAEQSVVQVFDPKGQRLRGFARHGDKVSDFHLPASISLDQANRVWIADTFSHDVKVYSTDGQFLTSFGEMGMGRGDFYFPSDIIVTSDMLYVVERAGVRLQAFRISGS